jgi:hypothetical protein
MEPGTFFNRAPQPRVAGVGRGSALGEPGGKWGASHPGRKSCSQETLPPNARPGDSRWKGWLDTVEADRYRKEAGAFLEKESGPAEKQARPLEEEIPELESCLSRGFRDPSKHQS